MALESVDRAGNQGRGADRADRAQAPSDARHPVEQQRVQEIRADAIRADAARPEDAVEVRSYREIAETYRAHQERLQQAMDGRRKILEAVREMMLAGGLESDDASRRAADGILRRGSVA